MEVCETRTAIAVRGNLCFIEYLPCARVALCSLPVLTHNNPTKVGYIFSIIFPDLQMRKLRYKEIKQYVQLQNLCS